MQIRLFLLSLSFVVIKGRLELGDLGDPCGRNNEGQITLIDDCLTGANISNVVEANDDWTRINNKVCCVKSHYPRDKKFARKSEEACSKFGPGIKRNVFSSKSVQPGEYQHNAVLGFEKESNKDEIVWTLCNGVLISENYVLTVAHCTKGFVAQRPTMVRLGNIDLTGEKDAVKPQDLPISTIIVHPDYIWLRNRNDIALLRLGEPAVFNNYVQPACLYTKPDTPDNLVATGWGKFKLTDSIISDILLKTNITTVDADTCRKTYLNPNLYDPEYEGQFCGSTDASICFLGPGSPAFIENDEDSRVTIVGLSSYSFGCSSSTPRVLLRVYRYLNWIEKIVWTR